MSRLESYANTELADAGTDGFVNVTGVPVMTAAAFMAGVAVCVAVVDAYAAGQAAGGTTQQL